METETGGVTSRPHTALSRHNTGYGKSFSRKDVDEVIDHGYEAHQKKKKHTQGSVMFDVCFMILMHII